jgi:hypothetical protein
VMLLPLDPGQAMRQRPSSATTSPTATSS